jgi:hypothetical protein
MHTDVWRGNILENDQLETGKKQECNTNMTFGKQTVRMVSQNFTSKCRALVLVVLNLRVKLSENM